MTLNDVLYAPNYIANIVSKDVAKVKSSVYYYSKLESIYYDDGIPLAKCPKFFGLPYLIVVATRNVVLTS
jgi:hypothetical protein